MWRRLGVQLVCWGVCVWGGGGGEECDYFQEPQCGSIALLHFKYPAPDVIVHQDKCVCVCVWLD